MGMADRGRSPNQDGQKNTKIQTMCKFKKPVVLLTICEG